MTGIILVAVFGVIVLIIGIVMVNNLIMRRNQVENAFAGIDAQLKKRFDLIPNLVAAVREYMTHERGVLEEITALRSKTEDPGLPLEEKLELDHKLSGMLRGLMVQVENYPQLKASANMEQLQRSLNEVEEQLAAGRRAYNAAVTAYNNSVEMFPSNIAAAILGYQRRTLFSIPEAERENVDVGALFKS